VYATPLGEPGIPGGISASPLATTIGAVQIRWTPVTSILYSTVYLNTNPRQQIGTTRGDSYVVYGLTPDVPVSFVVTATNTYSESPASGAVTVTPVSTSTQTVGNSAVANQTNTSVFNGDFVVTSTEATKLTYARVVPGVTVLEAALNTNSGPLTNQTNNDISATGVAITAPGGPSSSQFYYTRAAGAYVNEIAETNVGGVTALNLTNAVFNGGAQTLVVDSFSALDGTVSYVLTGSPSEVTSVAATGSLNNLSNTTFNGTFIISNVDETEFSYTTTAASATQETTAASGTVLNLTNQLTFNRDSATIVDVPAHNKLSYLVGTTTAGGKYTYAFNSSALSGTPGSGKVGFNSATLASIAFLYISYTDSSSADRSAWVKTWDDFAASSADRGRVTLDIGSTPIAVRVTGAVSDQTTYLRVPVKYLSGSLPANNASVGVAFTRTQDAEIFQPYGTVRRADSIAKLEIRYRSGWLG
jgi:hypothetical protein